MKNETNRCKFTSRVTKKAFMVMKSLMYRNSNYLLKKTLT